MTELVQNDAARLLIRDAGRKPAEIHGRLVLRDVAAGRADDRP